MSKAKQNKGNTCIRHYLVERFASTDFKLSELQVLLVVCRLTYGWEDKKAKKVTGKKRQRDRAEISYEVLVKMTGLSRKSLVRAMNSLQNYGVLICYRKPVNRTRKPGVFGINSDDSQWLLKPRYVPQSGHALKDTHVPQSSPTLKDTHVPQSGHACPSIGTQVSLNNSKKRDNQAEKRPSITEYYNGSNITDREQGAEKAEKEPSFGMKLWFRISGKYSRFEGPEYAKQSNCLKYEKHTSQNHELALLCFEHVWEELAKWESENGRKTYKPWKMLDDAADLFDRGGPSTPKPPAHPGYYDPALDPDFMIDDEEKPHD